jgi:cutinase
MIITTRPTQQLPHYSSKSIFLPFSKPAFTFSTFTMKSFTPFLFIALAASTPIVDVRQLRGRVGTTATEFTDGGCRDIIMLFARGSTEVGNMGTICGPPTANGLKEVFGANAVAVEGIDYGALLSTNFIRGGADPAGIREMQRLIGQAVSQCPDSKLVVGGYSQGAALTHRAVEDLPQAQKDAIVAAFTFGDTQNEQVSASLWMESVRKGGWLTW